MLDELLQLLELDELLLLELLLLELLPPILLSPGDETGG
jgi:hypothetical protein